LRYRDTMADAKEVMGFPLRVKGDTGAAGFKLLCNSTPIFV